MISVMLIVVNICGDVSTLQVAPLNENPNTVFSPAVMVKPPYGLVWVLSEY